MACKPDIPVGVILSVPADFTAWKFKLECVLSTRDCLSCLTEEPGEAASAAAIKKDQLARSIIGMNIANHLVNTVKNHKTAKAQPRSSRRPKSTSTASSCSSPAS